MDKAPPSGLTSAVSVGSPSQRRARVVAIALAATLAPSTAFAAEGGEAGATPVVVVLLLIVAAAYLLAHLVVGRLQRRFLILTGIEYVLLGVLLGPEVPFRTPALSHLDDLMPIVALAVGWVGLLRGMDISVAAFGGKHLGARRIVVVQAVVAGGLTAGAAYLAFTNGWILDTIGGAVGSRDLWMAVGVIGCTAAAASAGPIDLLARRNRIRTDTAERIRRIATFSDLLAVVVFGLLVCALHPVALGAPAQPSPIEWMIVSVALGGGLGVLFTPYLGPDDSENGRFLTMVGIIVLASGAAYFLDLSPLLVNLCLGAVLVNTAESGPQIRATLERTKQPMELVLLVFAGALWRPVDPLAGLAVTAGYIALRFFGKLVGARLATIRSTLRRDYHRGLLAHGEVSIAIVVSFRLVFQGPAVDLAYTAILGSTILSDLVAPRILRGLLLDSGALSELPVEPKPGAEPDALPARGGPP